MTTNKLELDMEHIAEHAQAIRLTGAGVFQVLAFILIINSSGFIYGGKETWIVLFMLAASVLAGFSLYRFLRLKLPTSVVPPADGGS